MRLRAAPAILLITLCAAGTVAQPPAVFFSDLVSGPVTGGKDGQGVFITVTGRHFGAERGNGYVTVGGGRAAAYLCWNDTKIIFQPGGEAASGQITVTTGGGVSNGVPFTVRPGSIYFVDDTSPGVPGSGTFEDPWRSPASFYRTMRPGDTCYFREGTYAERYGRQDEPYNVNFGPKAPSGALNAEIAWIGYPNETARFTADGEDIRGNIVFGYPKDHYVIAGLSLSSPAGCIGLSGNDLRVINNRCEGCREHAYAIIKPGGCNRVAIYGNELFGARSGNKLDHPLYIGYGSDNIDFGWNHLHDNDVAEGPLISVNTDDAMVKHYRFENIQIHDNIIDCRASSKPMRAIGVVATDTGSSVYIYNNVIIGCGGEPGGIYQYSASVYFYNNTIYRSRASSALYSSAVRDGENCYRPERLEIVNNIIDSLPGRDYVTLRGPDEPGVIRIESNCYHGARGAPGYDRSAVRADPLLARPDKGDFSLRPDSPCRDAGAFTTPVVRSDADGTPRPQGDAYDIGAHEHYTGGFSAE